jgi:hypothetical protein
MGQTNIPKLGQLCGGAATSFPQASLLKVVIERIISRILHLLQDATTKRLQSTFESVFLSLCMFLYTRDRSLGKQVAALVHAIVRSRQAVMQALRAHPLTIVCCS